MSDHNTHSIDSASVFGAGASALSVALMDARNHTLHLMGELEKALATPAHAAARSSHVDPPSWLMGHVGWFQERWIARNLQRQRGVLADPSATRLPSIEARADEWWDDERVPQSSARWEVRDLPDGAAARAYLLATLETTLELLDKAGDDDAALYFHRLALMHEDKRGEDLVVAAQMLGLPLRIEVPGPVAQRAPVTIQGGRWQIGRAAAPGFAWDNESPAHAMEVPEFEIDAQPVSWAQYVEFVDDGAYDRQELWHPEGWAWLLAQQASVDGEGGGGRAPLFVEQIGVASGAVMQTRFGTPRRMLGGQPVMHVSWYEADAWCRWAGRRLPAEVEWEIAASVGARRGWRWGDVWEWTASGFRPYPGFVAGPWRGYSEPAFGRTRALRGASFATRARGRSITARRFASPGANHMFSGFRSCAI